MYSIDFRKRAIEYVNEGHSQKELYEAFKIYPSTVNKWKKLLAETGSLAPNYPKKKKGKIDIEKLEAELERKPDLTLPELGKILGCTKQSVHGACTQNYPKKKVFTYKEQCEEKVKFYVICFFVFLVVVGVSSLVYVDETGVNREQRRLYARAKRGVKVYDKRKGQKCKRTNIIGGLCNGKHLAVQCYEHATNAAFFENWFEFELIPMLPERALIIMDNASFHRKQVLFDIASRYGVYILFLPPYSPELNPIELSWANFKRWLCDNFMRFPALDFAVDCYFSA